MSATRMFCAVLALLLVCGFAKPAVSYGPAHQPAVVPQGRGEVRARQPLVPELAPLAPLVGFCWRGNLSEAGGKARQPAQDIYDVHCFNSRMDGNIVSDRHTIMEAGANEGAVFCGETIFHAEPAAGRHAAAIAMRYYNINGLVQDGLISLDGARALRFPEEVFVGDDGREQQFRSVLRLIDATSYDLETWQRIGGVWRRMSDIRYRREEGQAQPSQYEACA